eukprot:216948_1
MHGGGDLEAVLKHAYAALAPHVARPANETGEVPLGRQVVADGKVFGPLFEPGIRFRGDGDLLCWASFLGNSPLGGILPLLPLGLGPRFGGHRIEGKKERRRKSL